MLGGKNIKIYLKLILIIDDETKSTLIESIVSLNKSLKERFKTFVSRFSELSSIEVIFSKNDFKISGDLLGVSGGFPLDKISSITSGYTFSKFENVSDDWKKQSYELVEFIFNYWKNRAENNK